MWKHIPDQQLCYRAGFRWAQNASAAGREIGGLSRQTTALRAAIIGLEMAYEHVRVVRTAAVGSKPASTEEEPKKGRRFIE